MWYFCCRSVSTYFSDFVLTFELYADRLIPKISFYNFFSVYGTLSKLWILDNITELKGLSQKKLWIRSLTLSASPKNFLTGPSYCLFILLYSSLKHSLGPWKIWNERSSRLQDLSRHTYIITERCYVSIVLDWSMIFCLLSNNHSIIIYWNLSSVKNVLF